MLSKRGILAMVIDELDVSKWITCIVLEVSIRISSA